MQSGGSELITNSIQLNDKNSPLVYNCMWVFNEMPPMMSRLTVSSGFSGIFRENYKEGDQNIWMLVDKVRSGGTRQIDPQTGCTLSYNERHWWWPTIIVVVVITLSFVCSTLLVELRTSPFSLCMYTMTIYYSVFYFVHCEEKPGVTHYLCRVTRGHTGKGIGRTGHRGNVVVEERKTDQGRHW